ncbi:hypothetical protein LTR84_003655 [Exophiala bonariae]|uniref:Uncharacterized protein n=1 Tax=Exophiala bonariae TaxID=1690606 RepID=A0AAV9N5R2_9EURO|nr:hypothetical protein LTR84_003655 [Exophiala bonariae]
MAKTTLSNSITIPSTDEEFRHAIQALQASTNAIEQQTRVFEAQATYLSNLRASEAAAVQRRATHTSYLSQRQAAEIQHITFTNEQLLENLRSELQNENESVAKDIKSVGSVVASIFNADDRAIDALNVLVSASVESTSLDTAETALRVSRLTSALQHFRVQALKDRLDSTYLRRLEEQGQVMLDPEGEAVPDESHLASETVSEVQNDLGSLYAEIDDVVTMTVRHEHAGPIEAALREIDCAREMEGRRVGETIHSQLAFLTDSLEKLSTKLETLQVQRTGLRDLLARTDLLTKHHPRKPPPQNPAKSTTTPSSTTTTSDTPVPNQPALSALLQHLSLSLPAPPLLHTSLQAQTTNLQTQSDAQVAEILAAAEKAAMARRDVLNAVTECLESETARENKRGVAELEVAVDQARVSMEVKSGKVRGKGTGMGRRVNNARGLL